MAIIEKQSDLLLQGSEVDLKDPELLYLDTGVMSHMTRRRNYFPELDESVSRLVKFGDNSNVEIQGRGRVFVHRQDGKRIYFGNVLFVPKLCANILSLGRLDEVGCRKVMYGGCLTIFDRDGVLLAEVRRTEGRLYLLKLNVIEQCLFTKKDEISSQLWHSRFDHLNFHSLKEMSSRKLVEGLPLIRLPDHIYQSCLAGK